MSTTKSKKNLFDELSETIQWTATLTVLHTNAVANSIGLSATEFEATDIIRRHQPITAGELAVYCGLTTGAITGLIDRLERAGFVKRVSDLSDRRKVLLEPIIDAEKFAKIHALYQPMAQAFDELIQDYSIDEIKFLLESYKKINTMTEKVLAEIKTK
jgi:DNA-binding MarR family transcriptional regulator